MIKNVSYTLNLQFVKIPSTKLHIRYVRCRIIIYIVGYTYVGRSIADIYDPRYLYIYQGMKC